MPNHLEAFSQLFGGQDFTSEVQSPFPLTVTGLPGSPKPRTTRQLDPMKLLAALIKQVRGSKLPGLDQARSDIQRRFGNLVAKQSQDLVSRGLSGTSIQQATERGAAEAESRALGRFDEQRALDETNFQTKQSLMLFNLARSLGRSKPQLFGWNFFGLKPGRGASFTGSGVRTGVNRF